MGFCIHQPVLVLLIQRIIKIFAQKKQVCFSGSVYGDVVRLKLFVVWNFLHNAVHNRLFLIIHC